ncbi:MAG: helix-turn-helix domain-containing protein [Magnetococcales bacterium]|nr:helix-turn-helix domain-containing protein [Magnetococcales bacterium]
MKPQFNQPPSLSQTKKLLTPDQAAEILEVSKATLNNWRCTGRYNLPFVKVGRAVRYSQEAIQAFIAKRTCEHG